MIVLTRLSGLERIRREQLQQVVTVGRRLLAEDAILFRRRDDLAAGLERAASGSAGRRGSAIGGIRGSGSPLSRNSPRTRSNPSSANEAAAELDIGVRLDALQDAVGGDELDDRELFRISSRLPPEKRSSNSSSLIGLRKM